jgi:hypothetical protein
MRLEKQWLFTDGRFTTLLQALLLFANALVYWQYQAMGIGNTFEKWLSIGSFIVACGMLHRLFHTNYNTPLWLASGIWAVTFVNVAFEAHASWAPRTRSSIIYFVFFAWVTNTWFFEELGKRRRVPIGAASARPT